MNDFIIVKLDKEKIGFSWGPLIKNESKEFFQGNIQNIYFFPKTLNKVFYNGIAHFASQRLPISMEIISNEQSSCFIHNAWISCKTEYPMEKIFFEYENFITHIPYPCPELQEYQRFILQVQKYHNLKAFW